MAYTNLIVAELSAVVKILKTQMSVKKRKVKINYLYNIIYKIDLKKRKE